MNTSLGKDKENKLLIKFIEYLFWILLILYTNPGGIYEALNVWYVLGKINVLDLLFLLLSILYLIAPKYTSEYDIDFNKFKKWLIFFIIYYLLVFAYIIPVMSEKAGYSLLNTLVKSRWIIYDVLLFIYIYEFFKRGEEAFSKVFLFSSIAIITLFILTIITKIEFLRINLMNRLFVDINRNMMFSEGIMSLLIPLGVVIIVFKLDVKFKNLFLCGFVLMAIYYVLSITRRDIIGIFFYFLLAILLKTFISKSLKVFFLNIFKGSIVVLCLTICIYFMFPHYIEATRVSLLESLNVVTQGKEIGGQKDERLGLRPFIVKQFLKDPLFGTGFDNRWKNAEGQKLGYKSSDYPFLSALAMYGIVGLLFFLPIYIILIITLKKDIKYLRIEKTITRFSLFQISFILFFIYHILQYINYFMAVANATDYFFWFFFLSFYLAARTKFYSLEISNKNLYKNIILTK